ncbi:MAG TPA: SdrD B-like domain-containing protein, partial [Thermoanaerobaculia bacterium]|nr:SdrD B-like domain-containing protein [Thermoanaerobaculia bacterium]
VLSEVVPPGFVQTVPPPPGTATFTLTLGQAVTGVLIGNTSAPTTGSISGTKYLDLNADGVLDPTDRPYPGIVFVLTDAVGVQRQTTSDANGKFSFTNLPPGTYVLSEILPPGFSQTKPGTPDHPATYTITLTPGQNATGFIFLNKC